jgi:hypothetical protein
MASAWLTGVEVKAMVEITQRVDPAQHIMKAEGFFLSNKPGPKKIDQA